MNPKKANQVLTAKSSSKEIMLALEKNMIEKFAYLPDKAAGMSVTSNKNVVVVNSNCKADMFNIICNATASDLEFIKNTVNIFVQKKLPFAWWAGFSKEPSNLRENLEALNLVCTEHELGMAISLDTLNTEDVSSVLTIDSVDQERKLDDFINVLTQQIPNDAEAIRAFYKETGHFTFHKNSLLNLFVGYVDEKPIATSALFCSSGVAGVWDVITLPESRGKGIGIRMTLAALTKGAKTGYRIGVLTASNEGQSVYKKIGFKSLQDFFIYNRYINKNNMSYVLLKKSVAN